MSNINIRKSSSLLSSLRRFNNKGSNSNNNNVMMKMMKNYRMNNNNINRNIVTLVNNNSNNNSSSSKYNNINNKCNSNNMLLYRYFSVSFQTIGMPSLSPTMTHGTIASWQKKPGDSLKAGDILCEIETDKASVGFELQDEGVLAKILVDAKGQELKCGDPIAIIVEDVESYQSFLKNEPKISTSTTVTDTPLPTPSAIPSKSTATTITTNATILLSPAARHMMESKSLNVNSVKGTSKHGIISKADLIVAIKNGIAIPETKNNSSLSETSKVTSKTAENSSSNTIVPIWVDPFNGTPVNDRFKDIPNSNMRKVIAKRLTESKATVPHFYVAIECEIDELLNLRKTLKKDLEVNVSVNDIVIKSAALALRDVNEVNAKWNKSTSAAEIIPNVDISVAVATPNGLITPIVTKASKRGIEGINKTVKDLATRARDNKLKPEEYQGGSFSISNLGMFGISQFSAVINPPQACILAVGAGVKKVVPPNKPDGKPRLSTTVTVQLSADRRVVDEALAAQFLQVFKNYISKPKNTVL